MKKASEARFFDQAHLKGEAYADPENLLARRDIYRFAQPDIPFPEWALSHLPPELGAVLDVGCGPGGYLQKLGELGGARLLVGIDLSSGMLAGIEARTAALCVGDAQALPFASHSFDTVTCMHVLYHVPDIRLAVSELGRAVASQGIVLVATNGANHQRRLRDLFDAIVTEVGGAVDSVLSSDRRFRLEEGEALLETHFESFSRHDLPRELCITEVEPVLRYLASIRSFHEHKLPAGVEWQNMTARLAQRIVNEIDREGSFRTPIHAGVFVCRRPL